MGLDRRDILKLSTAAAASTMLPGWAKAASEPDSAFEAAFQDTLTQLETAFGQLGLGKTQALSIVTGDGGYNGGLRHDFDQSALPTGAFVVQPLARVGDVDEKARADVLPLFHEAGCHPGEGYDGQMTTRLMVELLVETFGLDPSRLAFVSVPQSATTAPVLDGLGLPFSDKVLLRDEAEALAARDASGFFFPDPTGDAFLVTMGVYYRVGDTDEAAPASYPPSPNWTEVGEIVISGDVAPLGVSIGVERLTYALTGQYPAWDQRLGALFALIEEDRGDSSLPPGLSAFQ